MNLKTLNLLFCLFLMANQFIFASTNITEKTPIPSGYEIKVKIDGLKTDELIKMGYHFGDKQYLKDSIKIDNKGWAVFEGETPLESGIYFMLLPENSGFFEFLVYEQHFSLETSKEALIENMKVKNSVENKLFFENAQWNKQKNEEAQKLNEQLKIATTDAEKEKIKAQINEISEQAAQRVLNFQDKHKDTFFTKIITAGSDPLLPDSLKSEDKKPAALDFLKENYFNTFDFSDSRLARTSILTKKIDHYTNNLLIQNPDSIAKGCDKIIALAKADTNHYKVATTFLLNKYANPKIMGLEDVYVYLVEKYYNSTDAWWVKPADLFRIQDRAKSLKPTMMGAVAPNFKLQDQAGAYHNLKEVKTPYTILYFWDPDCGHCKKTSPKLVEFYKENKDLEVTIFTLTTENEKDKWDKYLTDNPDMNAFINLKDFEFRSTFRQDYDITGTPRIFVLDKDKKVIAKKIQPEQIRPIIDRLKSAE